MKYFVARMAELKSERCDVQGEEGDIGLEKVRENYNEGSFKRFISSPESLAHTNPQKGTK